MNQPYTYYVALAPRYQIVYDWCWRWGVNPQYIRPANCMQDLRGRDNYPLIFFSEWFHADLNNLRYAEIDAVYHMATQRAVEVFRVDSCWPEVKGGVIVDWDTPEGPILRAYFKGEQDGLAGSTENPADRHGYADASADSQTTNLDWEHPVVRQNRSKIDDADDAGLEVDE